MDQLVHEAGFGTCQTGLRQDFPCLPGGNDFAGREKLGKPPKRIGFRNTQMVLKRLVCLCNHQIAYEYFGFQTTCAVQKIRCSGNLLVRLAREKTNHDRCVQ